MKHQTKQCGGLIAHFVNGNLTGVRCSLAGKFVKHSIYFAIENQTITDNGITTDFSVVSLLVFVTSIVKANNLASINN